MVELFVPSTQVLLSQPQTVSFAASTPHVTHLAEVLHALAAIDRYTLLNISAEGVSFFSEQNHILNALANVDASLFSTYDFDAPDLLDLLLGIDVAVLSDLFAAAASASTPKTKNTAGSAATLVESVMCYIKYEGMGNPLIVEFEDRLMVELLEFSTFALDIENPYVNQAEGHESRGLIVDSSKQQFEVIMKGDIFANMLQDIEALDSEELYMFVSSEDSDDLLSFVSKCALGYLKFIYPSDKASLQKLEISADNLGLSRSSVVSALNFHLFIKIIRAVKQSIKCKMLKDSDGVISVQLLCKNVNCAGYPGTMITFNMLERVTTFPDSTPSDVSRLFDIGACEYIKEYALPSKLNSAPLAERVPTGMTYASFKTGTYNETAKTTENTLPLFF